MTRDPKAGPQEGVFASAPTPEQRCPTSARTRSPILPSGADGAHPQVCAPGHWSGSKAQPGGHCVPEPITFNEGPKGARFWHKCTRLRIDPQTHYSAGPCPSQVKKTSFHARYLPSLYILKTVPFDKYLVPLKLWCVFPTHKGEQT